MLSLSTVCETQPCKAKYGQGLEFENDWLFVTLCKNYLLLESNNGSMLVLSPDLVFETGSC